MTSTKTHAPLHPLIQSHPEWTADVLYVTDIIAQGSDSSAYEADTTSKATYGLKELPKVTTAKSPLDNPFKRIDRNLIYPAFLQKMEAVLLECEARGHRYFVLCGYRSAEEQNKLYAQGRGADKGKRPVVTNARGWESFHQYHVAMDMCYDTDMTREGLQPGWALEQYKVLAEVAQKHGLEAAYFWKTFKEGPHVQLPLERNGLTKERLRDVYLAGGKPALYALLGKYNW